MGKTLIINGANYETNRLDHVDLNVIHAENIFLSQTSISGDSIGQTYTLTATVVPSNAEDLIVWTSSNTNVATVSDGVVSVVGVGACTITATAGNVSASCTVNVAIYLTGYDKYKRSCMYAATAMNRLTSGDTVLGTSATSYTQYLLCCVSEMPYNHLMANLNFTKLVDSTYTLITDSADLSGGHLRFFTQIKYPTPIPLPPNTTKVRFICPDALHGAYPLFFKRNVEAYPAGSGTEGRGHFSPWRSYTSDMSGYTWPYGQIHDVDVPDNCDSLIVTFGTDTDNGGTLINDMTDAQIEEFKIMAM